MGMRMRLGAKLAHGRKPGGSAPVAFPATEAAALGMFVRHVFNEETPTVRSFTFAPSDVDTTNDRITIAGLAVKVFQGIATPWATPFVIESSNGTGGLPGGYTAGQWVYPAPEAGAFVLYPEPDLSQWSNLPGMYTGDGPIAPGQNFAQAQNKLNLTSQGTGTLTLKSVFPLLQTVSDLTVNGFSATAPDSADLHSYMEVPTDGTLNKKFLRLRATARDHTTNVDCRAGKSTYGGGPTSTTKNNARAVPAGKRWAGWTFVQRVYDDDTTGCMKHTVTSVNTGTNVFTVSGHGFVTGNPIIFRAYGAGALPSGLSGATTYYARSITGSTFSAHPTSTDATNNTNIVAVGTAGTAPFQVLCPTRHAESERARYYLEQLSPDSSGDACSPLQNNWGSSYAVRTEFSTAMTTAGVFGGAGKSLQGNRKADRMRVTFAPGATLPVLKAKNGGGTWSGGTIYISYQVSSSNQVRFHTTKAGALAADGVASASTDCLEFDSLGSGEISVEPDWEEGIQIGASQERNPVYAAYPASRLPTGRVCVWTVLIDYNDPAAATVKGYIYINGVQTNALEVPGTKGNLGSTPIATGAIPWKIGNSSAGHVPGVADVFEIIGICGTSAHNPSDVLALHTYAMSNYNIAA